MQKTGPLCAKTGYWARYRRRNATAASWAARFLTECHELAAQLEDPVLEAHAAHWSALHQLFCGNLPEAITLYEKAITVHNRSGDTASAFTALFQLAMAQTYNGDLDTALDTCRHTLALSSQHGERWTHAYALWVSGICHWRLGNLEDARKAARGALELQREFKDSICTALTIELASWIACSDERFEEAAELEAAASAVWTALGTSVTAFGPQIHADSLRSGAKVRKELGGRRMAEAAARHPHPSKEEAIALALGKLAPGEVPGAKAAPAPTKSPLTKRELEIAVLIAEGLSNRAIAQSLVISPRTVDGHVERILNKLDFASRTQVASWMASQVQVVPA